jgi:hypothetical protein
LFARLRETRKIFFGGAHDSGYQHTLTSLATEGHLHKITVLKTNSIAHDMERLINTHKLRVETISGLFLDQKLSSASHYAPPNIPFIRSSPAPTQSSSFNYNEPGDTTGLPSSYIDVANTTSAESPKLVGKKGRNGDVQGKNAMMSPTQTDASLYSESATTEHSDKDTTNMNNEIDPTKV